LVTPVNVAARPVQAADEPKRHWVEPDLEDDRDSRGCRLGRECRGRAGRGNRGHLTADQLGRQCRQPTGFILRPAVLDRDILALDITDFLEALAECRHHVPVRLERRAAQESDHEHRRLLGTRREWPRSRRAGEKCD
jgi:hypothetical protein